MIDKPSGWKTHPGSGPGPTITDWLTTLDAPGLAGLVPVHRLDKGTSGLLLCAADPDMRRQASTALAEGAIQKVYVALVHGKTRSKGVIRHPLVERGTPHPAMTRWRRLEVLGKLSLLSVKPSEGRKHQIRRHLHGIGHPIVGDDRYRSKRFIPVAGFPGRLWLHARALTWQGESIASPLPPELEVHLQTLRRRDTPTTVRSHAVTPPSAGEPETPT